MLHRMHLCVRIVFETTLSAHHATPVFKHSQKRKNVQNQWLLYQVTAHMWPSYGVIYENFNLALFEKNAFFVLALSTRASSKMGLYEAKVFCGS